MRRIVLVMVSVGLLAAAWIVPASAQTALPGGVPAPPQNAIQHLVVIVEENSTFDHVLGWLPMVDGHRPGNLVHHQVGQPGSIKLKGFSQLKPNAFVVNNGQEVLSNGPTAARQSYDNGEMDGFYRAQRAAGKRADLSFTYIDPNAIVYGGFVWAEPSA